ncbi:MAG: hypothetical protein IJU27_07925, partial [Bacteroidales bacterium]|nr:hypothetical protein [Bacteroidales bacterium]
LGARAGGDGAGGDGTRATLGNVRGGTVSGANGGVERSETVPVPELPRSRQVAPRLGEGRATERDRDQVNEKAPRG